MDIISDLLQEIALPKMVLVRQRFSANEVADIAATLRQEIRKPAIAGRVKANMRIAVAVGSRGMAEIAQIVKIVVEELKALGASPFIVPAMGSHGGATAEGQVELLAGLGVTETSAGCPILSSMETVELGALDNGLPVLMDKNSMTADGIVAINRIKPHTSFSGPMESGLVKMIAVGLGKQKGADSCHAFGFGHMAKNIVDMARIKLQRAPILFGVGTVENAYENVAKIRVIPPEELIETEKQLLLEAKANMPKILFTPIDVLIVDQMGKEFAGTGIDANITGRASTPFVTTSQTVNRMAVLDLTDKSHGNAVSMGLADIITRRLFNKVDFTATYANALTARVPSSGGVPMVMESDRRAIQAAIKTCGTVGTNQLRLVRIPNTLHIEEIYIAECMLEEAQQHSDISVLGKPEEWKFDSSGNLVDVGFGTAQ
ncbi:MAG: lactate racemase domain-containing protein [Sporomusa sp.]